MKQEIYTVTLGGGSGLWLAVKEEGSDKLRPISWDEVEEDTVIHDTRIAWSDDDFGFFLR